MNEVNFLLRNKLMILGTLTFIYLVIVAFILIYSSRRSNPPSILKQPLSNTGQSIQSAATDSSPSTITISGTIKAISGNSVVISSPTSLSDKTDTSLSQPEDYRVNLKDKTEITAMDFSVSPARQKRMNLSDLKIGQKVTVFTMPHVKATDIEALRIDIAN